MTAGLMVPGNTVGPVQLATLHTSPEISVTVYDWSVTGVLPLFWRDRVKLVRVFRMCPDRVNDSGAGSTTLTVRMHE